MVKHEFPKIYHLLAGKLGVAKSYLLLIDYLAYKNHKSKPGVRILFNITLEEAKSTFLEPMFLKL
jgi:hypothetical protein